jgi:cell division protein FtsN
MEKTYFDIRVTFIHVIVFLVAMIAIGIFLFYMGYQAGHRLTDQPAGIVNSDPDGEESAASRESLDRVAEKPVAATRQSIPSEMKLHEKKQSEKKESPAAQAGFLADRNYAIQVGAFDNFANAQNYSERFARLGYQTEIIAETVKEKKLYTVRVGSFATFEEAQKEKARLEGLENKKFIIKKGH